MKNEIKMMWNGMKVNGQLTRGRWSKYSDGRMVMYCRDYSDCPKEIYEAFECKNETDIMTDYFERDRIIISADHPLRSACEAAMEKAEEHDRKNAAKHSAKMYEYYLKRGHSPEYITQAYGYAPAV